MDIQRYYRSNGDEHHGITADKENSFTVLLRKDEIVIGRVIFR